MEEAKKVRLVGAVVALSLVALATWYFARTNPVDMSRDMAPTATAKSSATLGSVPQGQQSGNATPGSQNPLVKADDKAWNKGNFYAELATASDLRSFAEKAKRTPEKGGVLYAALAMNECRISRGPGERAMFEKVNGDISAGAHGGDLSSLRINALNWLKSRCASFTDGELGSAELVSFKAIPAADQDALWKLRQEVSAKPTASLDATQREAYIMRILHSKEPALLDRVRALAWTPLPGVDGGVSAIYVDKLEFGGLNPEHFEFAWSLMACKLAGTCEIADVNVVRSCAFNGMCGANMLDSVQKNVGAQFPQVLAVATKLQEAIERGDVSRFRPPSK